MEFNHNNSGVNVNELLYQAETITNAFAKTLEDNNCLLILTIGLHREIVDNIKDLEEASGNASDTNDLLDGGKDGESQNDILDVISDIVDNLKDQCMICDLDFPDIKFDIDLKGMMANLTASLDLFKSIFKINKLDLCQPAYAMQSSCVPDILRLITLLLTAFVSIMTLRKLSNISITAFIKGVLSTLLSKIMQSLKITVDIGSTNISCLINALKEIALAIPTQENIMKQLDDNEKLALGLIDANGEYTNNNNLRSSMLDSLNTTLNSKMDDLAKMDRELGEFEDSLNESFEIVNAVVASSINELNNYIQSLLGFQTHFECETKRSGMDVEEAITMINKLIQVINMLSSLVLSMVKKNMREDACKTSGQINSISSSEIDDLQIKDMLEDMNQKVVEIIESDDSALELIIHDIPVNNGLPKLDLLDCSIDNFIESHTLPKIIEIAKKQIEEEDRRIITPRPESNYTFKKPSPEQRETIENIVDLIYTKPEKEKETKVEEVVVDIKNPIGVMSLSSLLSDTIRNDKSQTDLACKSVEDVLNILNSIKR